MLFTMNVDGSKLRLSVADWVNYLISKASGSHSHVDPQAPVPNANEMAQQLAALLKRNFAVFMGLNAEYLERKDVKEIETTTETVESTRSRIVLSPYVFEISLSILVFDLLVALVIVLNRPMRLLPRMPTNIAAVIQSACHSHLLQSIIKGETTQESILQDQKARYGFGTFLGSDKKLHKGIERYPLVTAANCRGARRHLRWLNLKRFGRKLKPTLATKIPRNTNPA